jgi:adenylate cyclase
MDLERLLPELIDQALHQTGATVGAVLLTTAKGELVPRYVRSPEADFGPRNLVLSKALLVDAMAQKSARISNDPTPSTLAAPLLFHGEILGMLTLSTSAGSTFTEKELGIAREVAERMSLHIQIARLAKALEQERNLCDQLQRTLSPDVAARVVGGGLVVERGRAALSDVTVLISGIRGFTAICEGADPRSMVGLLDEHFEQMAAILLANGGTLEKFMGDGLIGLFGPPALPADAAFRATACALEMQRAMRAPHRIAIGLHSGEVATGFLGSSQVLKYAAIGDTMNTAVRLQSIAKAGEVLLSAQTKARLGDRVEAISRPPVELKGKREKLQFYVALSVT